jgi:L-threonylcarbamoyladenylate synthase
VFPTDTLYALGADIWNEEAVRSVFTAKQRPLDQPVPIAVSSLSDIEDIAVINTPAHQLAHHFLPGALTLVLQKKTDALGLITSGKESIAVRIPNHPIALALLSTLGPLTVTSANLHNTQPHSTVFEIAQNLSSHSSQLKYLDAGELKGKPSTIVDCTTPSPKILRQGAIPSKAIRDALTNE